MSEATLTWLHLTDVHVGASKNGYNPENLLELLVSDVEQLLRDKKLPAPDLVFFTGDLVQSGLSPQYMALNGLLDRFWRRMKGVLKREPLLVPVPGNHDLAWQELSLDELVLWRTFHTLSGEVRNQFFDNPCSAASGYWLRERVTTAFAAYTQWLQTTTLPVLARGGPGIVPGQYATSWTSREGLKVGILALNSAYYDLPSKQRPEEGKLALYMEQLEPLLEGQTLSEWCDRHHLCLMLTHHPPSWLDEHPRARLEEFVVTPNQIALHLCGHLHDVEASHWGTGWGERTLLYQGRSVSGLDGYLQQQPPSFGYALGALSFTGGQREARLRMYPRFILHNQRPFVFRPEPTTEPNTQALPEKRVLVRPWLKQGGPQDDRADVRDEARQLDVSPRPIPIQEANEIFERLTLPRSDGRCGVYLRAPSRFGKTHLVQWLTKEIQAQTTEDLRIPIRIDLVSWSSEKNWEPVLTGILEYISEATQVDNIASTTFELSIRKTLQRLRAASQKKVVLVLMFESLDTLNPAIRGYFEAHLRAAFDRLGYRSQPDGGLRVLLASRFPRATTLLNPAGGSSLLPFLHEIQLKPLSREAALAWARQHEHWTDADETLLWIYQQTQGHPEFFTRLVLETKPLEGERWLELLRESQDNEESARVLYSSAQNLITQAAELVKQTAEEFWQSLPPTYQNRIVRPQPNRLKTTPRKLTPEEACLASGLFLRHGNGTLEMIPFAQHVLELASVESGETQS